MFHLVLVNPEIPPNTGNIIRLCANTACSLHLIHPIAFEFDDKRLRRAGLDYHEFAQVQHHDSLEAFLNSHQGRLFAIETTGDTYYSDIEFKPGDTFIFGSESTGLTADLLQKIAPEKTLLIPMHNCTRSLNLSNCAALILYEAWRQLDFKM